jgi:HPt (histidine-containing phosphotransfer) domain-containing protein
VSSHLERHAPVTAPVDPSVIEPLRDLGLNDFRQLIEMFLDEAAGRVARLQVFQQHGDTPGMASVSHALRGTSAAFGAAGLAALCSEIEAIATAPGSSDLAMLVGAVAVEFERVRTALTEELA